MNLKNNLFTYATSELSQDAFLGWLISFADDDCLNNNRDLHDCSKKFLCSIIPELENKSIHIDKIDKQYEHIDVLVTINDYYKLIIEDKTYTQDHDNQLKRYKEKIENDFPDYKVIGLYYITGFQSDYSEVLAANYQKINRTQMLEILKPFNKKIENQIWKDYYIFLDDFENEVNKFNSLSVKDWTWRQIYGFYNHLKNANYFGKEYGCNYGYVANSSGGFDGIWFWLNNYKYKPPCELCLQLEFTNREKDHSELYIRLKMTILDITSKDRSMYSQVRDNIIEKYQKYPSKDDFFKRPPRLGCGISMTVGEYKIPSNLKSSNIEKEISRALDIYKGFSNYINIDSDIIHK